MMKTNNLRINIITLVLLLSFGLHAQVSINNTGNSPDSSAMLDIQSTEKGILIPRMTTAQRTAIYSPAAGLIVFDTDAGSFWFWSGSAWSEVGTAREWSLTGNAGTVEGTNFLGTTDDVALDLRTNNSRALRLEYAEFGGDPLPNVIGGYQGNYVDASVYGATISGGGRFGQLNRVTSIMGTVGGGVNNLASGNFSTVSGGSSNIASGVGSNVPGGNGNHASGDVSVISGGGDNTASGEYSVISGGYASAASGSHAVVAGGLYNVASGPQSTVLGGFLNLASGFGSVAAGVQARNNHLGTFLFSDGNSPFDFNSVVQNEFAVRATGGVRFVTAINGSGTPTQTVTIDSAGTVTANAFIGDGSGLTNLPITGWSLTGNTGTNTSTHFIGTTDDMPLDFRVNDHRALRLSYDTISSSIIGGFSGNSIANGIAGSTIAGGGYPGAKNSITADFGFIGSGTGNSVTGYASVIAGGRDNQASEGYGSVGGGFQNHASGIYSHVGGGHDNIASELNTTISGGWQNDASGRYSTVGGGLGNNASAKECTIAGGDSNTTSGDNSSIGGGAGNIASGFSSTIPGGYLNNAGGDYSFASGRRARIDAAHDGVFMFADQNNFDFNSEIFNEFAVRATGGVRFVTSVDGSGNPTRTVRIDTSGTVIATVFVGDGSGLTNIPVDNLGDHTATQALNMSNQNVINGDTIAASTFVGDGSLLTGTNDNLGNHTATQNLKLNGNYLSGDGENEGIYVTDGGNVGVGMNNPDQRLHVAGSTQLKNGVLVLTNNYTTADLSAFRKSIIDASFNIGGPDTLQKINFKVSNGTYNATTTVMTLAGHGHVGIGTTNPNRPLAIKGNGSISEWLSLIDNAGTTQWHINNRDGGLNFAETGAADGRLFLDAGGKVGIGTTNPTQAKLVINGSASHNLGNYGYLNSSGNTGVTSGTSTYSLYASHRIAASEFNAHSDARIKNIHGQTDSRQDLNTLMDIEITNYTLIDTIAKGDNSYKKVIAQQVEEVYPQAVTTTVTEVVPDIYQRAIIQDGWILLATDLKVGERVKIITDESSEVYDVSEVEPNRFTVPELQTANWKPQTAFVYGREVNDFHTVDYEAIAMLNVSATQEQQRIIEQQQQRIAVLEARSDRLEQQLAEVNELKAAFENLQQSLNVNSQD